MLAAALHENLPRGFVVWNQIDDEQPVHYRAGQHPHRYVVGRKWGRLPTITFGTDFMVSLTLGLSEERLS